MPTNWALTFRAPADLVLRAELDDNILDQAAQAVE